MEPPASSGRKCRSCNELFRPAANNKATQCFCAQAACRKASKAHSNARWRRNNPGYDRGPEQVERVRQWRAAHPGYSRGKKRPDPPPPLQDLAQAQSPRDEPLTEAASPAASDLLQRAPTTGTGNAEPLQDLVPMQTALLVGFIATVAGEPLQESFAVGFRRLVERGRRVLAQDHAGFEFMAAPHTANTA